MAVGVLMCQLMIDLWLAVNSLMGATVVWVKILLLGGVRGVWVRLCGWVVEIDGHVTDCDPSKMGIGEQYVTV